MSAVQNEQPHMLVFTDSAAAKVYELIQEEENHQLNLRVFITGGGCSGFQYGFTFDETIQDDDTVVEKVLAQGEVNKEDEEDEEGDGGDGDDGDQGGTGGDGVIVRLLVDPMSFQYLAGAQIDYKEDVNGARFIIRNPNAKTTCGCGSSFSA